MGTAVARPALEVAEWLLRLVVLLGGALVLGSGLAASADFVAQILSALGAGTAGEAMKAAWASDAKVWFQLLAVLTGFVVIALAPIRIPGLDPVVVLGRGLALELFGATCVVGRGVFMRGSFNAMDSKTVERRTVIGVSRDTDVGSISRRGGGIVYVPLAQRYESPNFVVGRSDTGEGDMRGLIRAGDPDLAVDAIGPGLVMLGGGWNAIRIVAGVALVLGVMTLVLTMAGLFGVLSALVSRRTREIGIRKALGADNHAIRRLIFRDGSRPVASGSAIGLFLGVIGGFLIRASIPSGAPPLTLVAVALVAVTVIPATLIACYLPARRAMRVDPNVTLKDV